MSATKSGASIKKASIIRSHPTTLNTIGKLMVCENVLCCIIMCIVVVSYQFSVVLAKHFFYFVDCASKAEHNHTVTSLKLGVASNE